MLKKTILAVGVTSLIASGQVSAGLYINPTIEPSVPEAATSGNSQIGSKTSPDTIEGSTPRRGKYKMSEDGSDYKVFSYGSNVPLKIALETVVPNSSEWLFKIDTGLSENPVSWNGGETWQGVVGEISKSNDVHLTINYGEKVIGAAVAKDLSKALASREVRVFKLDGSKMLRENLNDWSEKAGYQDVIYQSDIKGINYAVPNATFIGKINVEGGSLDQLLLSLNKDARVPLTADFKEGNKIIYIKKKVSQKEAL